MKKYTFIVEYFTNNFTKNYWKEVDSEAFVDVKASNIIEDQLNIPFYDQMKWSKNLRDDVNKLRDKHVRVTKLTEINRDDPYGYESEPLYELINWEVTESGIIAYKYNVINKNVSE